MSDAEDFLSRWSRLKRDENPDAGGALKPGSRREEGALETPEAPAASEVAPPFDPATLPPVETIDAGSNIRAFLAPGVPATIKRAALRRAWSSDPSIRDFVGLSENSWDFNAPETIFGFGSIEKEKIQELLERVLGGPRTPDETERRSAPMPEADQVAQLRSEAGLAETTEVPPGPAVSEPEAAGSAAMTAAQDRSPQDGSATGIPHDVKTPQLDRTGIAPQNGSAPRRQKRDVLLSRRHGGALPE